MQEKLKTNSFFDVRISIKNRLYLSLAIVNVLMFLIVFFSWSAFRSTKDSFSFLATELFHVSDSVSEIVLLTAELNILAPQLFFSQSHDELEEAYDDLVEILKKNREIAAEIQNLDLDHPEVYEFFFEIETLNVELENYIQRLYGAMDKQISLNTKQEQNTKSLARWQAAFVTKITPFLDDAYYDLFVGLENENIAHEKLSKEAETLTLLLQIQSEGNLLAGIASTSLNYDEVEGLPALKEDFEASLGRMIQHFSDIKKLTKGRLHDIHDVVYEMRDFGMGEENVFDLQTKRLLGQEIIQKDIKHIEVVTSGLRRIVWDLDDHFKNDINVAGGSIGQNLSMAMIVIVSMSAIGVLFTVFIGWVYIRNKVVQRLEYLSRIMLALAKKDFSVSIEGREEKDELGLMSRTLFTFREKLIENEMLTSDLNEALERGEKARQELLETGEQLKGEKEKADKANAAKSEFLANMSHELRTPLNSILGMSQILAEDIKEGTEEYDMVVTVHKSASSLLNIVNDILDLSKIEANQMVLEDISFDFKSTLISIVEALAPIASTKGLSLNCKFEKEALPYLKGDPTRVGRILTNLIGNAIKYTEQGVVDVSIEYAYTTEQRINLVCHVTDTGIGIPEDKLDIIFDKFTQSDESTTRRYGGTGLGLAICRDLVEMMDGKIGVKSVLGVGSVFWFEIPFETADKLENAKPLIKEVKCQNKNKNRPKAEDVNILVAEDHKLNQIFLEKLLKRINLKRYTIVENGVQAVEAFTKGRYDLILMDCHMPEKNGYEATEEIRKLSETGAKVPILALTADAMLGTREKCLAAGMTDYLSKPIDLDELKASLCQWIYFPDTKGATKKNVEPEPVKADKKAKGEEILDPTALNEFADTKEEAQDFYRMFIEKTDEAMEELQPQCTEGTNEAWVEITHKMKGSAAMLGAMPLSNLCKEAQMMAAVSAKQREDIFQQIKEAYEALKNLIQRDFL